MMNTVQKERAELWIDKHAWIPPTLSVCMLPHAGSDNSWTWPSLWQSAALCTEPGKWREPGDQSRACCCVDSGQWAGVDS